MIFDRHNDFRKMSVASLLGLYDFFLGGGCRGIMNRGE